MLVSIFEWECSMIEYASCYKNNGIVSRMIISVFWRIFVGLSAVDCCAQKLLVSFYKVLWNGVATLAVPSIQWTVNYVGWLLYVPTVTVFTFDVVCVSVNWCLILHIVWTRLSQTLGSPWILKSHSFTVVHCNVRTGYWTFSVIACDWQFVTWAFYEKGMLGVSYSRLCIVVLETIQYAGSTGQVLVDGYPLIVAVVWNQETL